MRGNYIGTDASGTVALGNSGYGVSVAYGSDTIIGGIAPYSGNVISGNWDGIIIYGTHATGNVVEGNFIGTDVTGTVDLGNTGNGVRLGLGHAGAYGNRIGRRRAGQATSFRATTRTESISSAPREQKSRTTSCKAT